MRMDSFGRALLIGACAAGAMAGRVHAQDAAVEAALLEDQKRALHDLRAADPRLTVSWDARNTVPRSLAGRLSAPSTAPAEAVALDFVRTTQDLFRIASVRDELAPPTVERDQLGMSHVRFRQLHRGIEVLGGELRIHQDEEGVVRSLEAELTPALSLPTEPLVSAREAALIAARDLSAAPPATAPHLVIFDRGRFAGGSRDDHLAWHVSFGSEGGEWIYLVDALDGEVAFKYSNRHSARDREVRDHVEGGCNLGTLLYNEAGPVVPSPPQDATNAFNFGATIHAYYLNTHGRDSYDGAGGRMVAVVREPVANAQWSPSCQRTMFGSGYATKDVVAHEWQHAVTQFTANLVYSCQSGALNESFSDVFGAMVDRDDWLMGEDLAGGYIRSLADPRVSRPPQPDTNAGASPCAAVHLNSGIPNKVAYLVSDGGVHNGVTVAGMGRGVTETVWFRALRFHLGSSSTFDDARAATINAASTLYGSTSAAACAVANAWASVAVGSVCAAPANDAAFVAQSVPASMAAGTHYAVSVTMRNTGTTTWTTAASYRLGSQNPQDNSTWSVGRVALPVDPVPPGAQATFAFTVRAPAAAGTYNFQWRMLRELVEWFGAYTPNVAVSVVPGVPAAPSGVTAAFNTVTRNIELRWQDNSNNEEGFQTQFTYSGSAWSDLAPPTTGPNVTLRLIGPNPLTGGPYQFRVRAFRSGQFSAWASSGTLVVPPAASPEVRLMRAWDGVEIADGGSFAFPDTPVAALPISRVFDICNDGSGSLTIANPGTLVSGAGFVQLSTPASTVAPGACTNVRVRFHVASPGTYGGALTIQNDDANENPYDVGLSGRATP
ncbi:MAG: M4 family metallopeptidase [Vicinamibacteria bacterium]